MAFSFRAARSISKAPLGHQILPASLYRGIIAAYQFNEGGGATLYDATGSSPVALSGSTFNWTTGRAGPAVNFNTLAIGVGTRTDALDPLTFSVWLNVSDTATGQGIVNKSVDTGFFGSAPTTGWEFRVSGGGFIFITVNGLTLQVQVPSANSWHHYVFYWDQTGAHTGGANNDANSGAFVDGVAGLISNASATPSAYTSDSGSPLRFAQIIPGSIAFGNTFPLLNGQIESFMAWNRILSASEVQDLFAATYPSVRPRYVYGLAPPSTVFTATASAKSGVLGIKILKTIAAVKSACAGVLIPRLFIPKLLTATASTKSGVLIIFRPVVRAFFVSALQKSGGLGRKILRSLSAAVGTKSGVLTRLFVGSRITLTATKIVLAGLLTTRKFILLPPSPGMGINFLGGNGVFPLSAIGTGNVYVLPAIPDFLPDDDYGQVFPSYTTYFFVGHEQERALQLGSHRKLLSYLTSLISGAGNISIVALANILSSPWPESCQRALAAIATFDLEWAGGSVTAQRVAFQFSSSPSNPSTSLNNGFVLEKITATMKPAKHLPVRGSV